MMGLCGEIRIIKDHFYFRVIKRTRPLTIHTESLHKEGIWKAAKKFVESGGTAIWFVVTPVNFDFVNTESGCSLSRRSWEKLILERYRWLSEHGQKIEVHVHLRVKMKLYDSEHEAKKD